MKGNVIKVDFSLKGRRKKNQAKFSFIEKIKKIFLFFKKKSNVKLTSSNYKHIR